MPAKRPCPLVQGQLSQAGFLGLPDLEGLPTLNIRFSSSRSSPKPFLQLPRHPQRCLPLPWEWGAERGQDPFSGSWPGSRVPIRRGAPGGSRSPVLYTLSPGNPRGSRFGTGSAPKARGVPRTLGGATSVLGALAFHLPRGFPASRPPPNILS